MLMGGGDVRNLLEVLKDALGTIAVVFACAASVFCVLQFGEGTVLLIAICAFILYAGLSVTLKLMDKEDKQ